VSVCNWVCGHELECGAMSRYESVFVDMCWRVGMCRYVLLLEGISWSELVGVGKC